MASGKKTGGRKKGSRNLKPTKAAIAAQLAGKAAKDGVLPVEYMLAVLRDPQADILRRDDMAKAAAPYLHARLASVDHTTKGKALPPNVIINV